MSLLHPTLNPTLNDTFQNVLIKKSAEMQRPRNEQQIFPISRAQFLMNQKIHIDQPSTKKQSFSFVSSMEENGRNLSIMDYEKQMEDRFRTTLHIKHKTQHQFPDKLSTPGPQVLRESSLDQNRQVFFPQQSIKRTPITTNAATISQSQNNRKSFQISTYSHQSNFSQLLSHNTKANTSSDYRDEKQMNVTLKNFKQVRNKVLGDDQNTSSGHFRNFTADPIGGIRNSKTRRIAQILSSERKNPQKQSNIDIESGETNQKLQDKLLNHTFTQGRNNMSIYEQEGGAGETVNMNNVSSYNHSENRIKFNTTCYMDQKNQILKEARRKEQIYLDRINELENNLKQTKEELNRIKDFARQYINEMIDTSSINTNELVESQELENSVSQIGDNSLKKSSRVAPSALEVHRLYHDLYLTDLKTDIETAQKEVTNIRQDKVDMQKKMLDLKKDNQDLKNSLKRYRSLLVEQEKKVSDLQAQMEKANRGTGVFTMKLENQSMASILSNQNAQNIATSQRQDLQSHVNQPSRFGTNEHIKRKEINQTLTNSLEIDSNQIILKNEFSFSQALNNQQKVDKLLSGVIKDDLEDNKIGTPMMKNEELLLKQLTITQKLDQLSRFSKVLLGSTNLKQLFNQLRITLKTIFRCETSYFLLHKKEICKDFKEEKGITSALRIENEWYEGVIHDIMRENENINNIKIEFNQRDIQGGIIKGSVMCWPVFSNKVKGQNKDDEVYMIIQINGHKTYSYKAVDGTIMNIISKIVAGAIEGISYQTKSLKAVQRSFDILNIFKSLLSERNHALLFYKMSSLFPKLFNFKESGVLFMDVKSKHLYSINSDDYEQTAIDLNEENIVRYPNNIGLTGVAISKKDVIASQTGYKDRQFAPEVDNYININKIDNMLIGAMIDRNGEVKGVLQLINKGGGDSEITEQDIVELRALLPALGEIIRTADESMEISRLSYALQTCLGNINTTVFDKNKDIGQNNLAMLDQMMRTMKTQINNLVNHKKEYVFGGDKGLVQDVFFGIKAKLTSLQNDGKGGIPNGGLGSLLNSLNNQGGGFEDELGNNDQF